jgi:hypothetical protein
MSISQSPREISGEILYATKENKTAWSVIGYYESYCQVLDPRLPTLVGGSKPHNSSLLSLAFAREGWTMQTNARSKRKK